MNILGYLRRFHLKPVRAQQARVMLDLRRICMENEQQIRSMPMTDSADYDNLIFLLSQGLERNDHAPVDKTGRWIGFVQCALIVRGILDTSAERNGTRQGFHQAYQATAQAIPPTVNRPTG